MSATEVRLPPSPPASVAFHPVVDLDTGTAVAVETHTAPPVRAVSTYPAGSGTFHDTGAQSLNPVSGGYAHSRTDPAEEDVRRALAAARATAEAGTPLPLQLMLRAETVAAGQVPLTVLHNGLRDAGRRPNEVIVCVTGSFAPALRAGLSANLHGLRKAGYLVGFAGLGTAYTPLDLLVEGTPYMLKLDPGLTRQVTADPRYAALVEAVVSLAHHVGTLVLAPGVTGPDQLAALRALGVRLAQGPLLSGSDWRPGLPVHVPLPVPEEDSLDTPSGRRRSRHRRDHHDDLGPRVSEFTLPAVTMPLNATADDVLTALNAERGTSSVVLVDESHRPRHTVDRTRFLLAISGAYGHALHAHKAASRLADDPRLVPKTVPAVAALRAAGRDGERVYDDLVVIDELGRCLGIIRVSDLIRSLSP